MKFKDQFENAIRMNSYNAKYYLGLGKIQDEVFGDAEGLSFTYWDHESGNEIDGAVWSDIVSFLKAIEEENES